MGLWVLLWISLCIAATAVTKAGAQTGAEVFVSGTEPGKGKQETQKYVKPSQEPAARHAQHRAIQGMVTTTPAAAVVC